MKRHRVLHRQMEHVGDSPDGGGDYAPDSRSTFHALHSGMSPLLESPRAAPVADDGAGVSETRPILLAAPRAWRPAVNAYCCHGRFVVFADLAGVPPESVSIHVEPDRLVIRGTRPAPEPAPRDSDDCQLLALEIDHGTFERALDLPHPVNPDEVTTEYRDGFFRITLSQRT